MAVDNFINWLIKYLNNLIFIMLMLKKTINPIFLGIGIVTGYSLYYIKNNDIKRPKEFINFKMAGFYDIIENYKSKNN